MIDQVHLSSSVARKLRRWGLWAALAMAVWLLYIIFGREAPSIPPVNECTAIPYIRAEVMKHNVHGFKHYNVARDIFNYRAVEQVTPFAVIEKKTERALATPPSSPPPPSPPPPAPQPDMHGLELTGIVERQNEGNIAIVEEKGAQRTWFLYKGDRIRNATVVRIGSSEMAVETDRRVQALLSLSGFGKIEVAPAQSANDVGGVVAPDLSADLQLGVSVRAATKQELEKANTPAGVYVFHVARMIGLQEGDILRAINGNAVNSVAEAASRCARLRSEEKISLEIVRNSTVKTISVSLLGE